MADGRHLLMDAAATRFPLWHSWWVFRPVERLRRMQRESLLPWSFSLIAVMGDIQQGLVEAWCDRGFVASSFESQFSLQRFLHP